MKTIPSFLLLLLLMGAVPVQADDETYTWTFTTGEADEVLPGTVADVTTGSSSVSLQYSALYPSTSDGDMLGHLAFKGYNPGKEQVRHVRVWLSNQDWHIGREICVYDGDCLIPHGGSAEERILLLDLPFSSPFRYSYGERFYMKIECTGEAQEEPLFFECQSGLPIAMLTASAPVRHFSGTVTNQDGTPISGAQVRIRHSTQRASSAAPYIIPLEYTDTSDEQGRYSVRIERGNDTYFLKVSASNYADYSAEDILIDFNDTRTLPVADIVMFSRLDFIKDRRATIILPEAPDPSWGRYYRLDRRERNEHGRDIIFEREYEPKANVPYVLFPDKDFSVDLAKYATGQLPEPGILLLPEDDGIHSHHHWGVYGSYKSRYAFVWDAVYALGDKILDEVPDYPADTNSYPRVGPFRAFLFCSYALEYGDRLVFAGEHAGIYDSMRQLHSTPFFDLQGRRLDNAPTRSGLYIKDGRKVVVR